MTVQKEVQVRYEDLKEGQPTVGIGGDLRVEGQNEHHRLAAAVGML